MNITQYVSHCDFRQKVEMIENGYAKILKIQEQSLTWNPFQSDIWYLEYLVSNDFVGFFVVTTNIISERMISLAKNIFGM